MKNNKRLVEKTLNRLINLFKNKNFFNYNSHNDLSRSTNSLAKLYERINHTEEERKNRKIEEISNFNDLENYAANFDYTQLHDLLTKKNGQVNLSFKIATYRTIYTQKKILWGFSPTKFFWVSTFIVNINPSFFFFVSAMFVFIHIVELVFSGTISVGSFLLPFSSMLIFIFSGIKLQKGTMGKSFNRQRQIEITLEEAKQIKLFELRTLFMQLSKMNLNPQIKIYVKPDEKINIALNLSKK